MRITQIEAGARRSRFRDVELGALLADIADIYEPVVEESGGNLVSTLNGVRAPITGDRELLTQLFANLIENAIRHAPQGTRIDIGLTEVVDRYVAIVADQGPGIPEDERGNVFRRLYRLERERSTSGSGLGLSLVAAIADCTERVSSYPTTRRGCGSRCHSRAGNKKVQRLRRCTKYGTVRRSYVN